MIGLNRFNIKRVGGTFFVQTNRNLRVGWNLFAIDVILHVNLSRLNICFSSYLDMMSTNLSNFAEVSINHKF
jgi:hypothetical protein